MKWSFFFLFLMLTWLAPVLSAQSGYWLVDDFFKNHPAEKQKFDNLDSLVQEKAQPLKNPNRTPIRITMIYPGQQVSDYWRRSKKSFIKRLDELNIAYELKDFFTKPGTEIRKQARLILNAVKTNTDYLIFTLDASKHKKLIEQLVRNQKPKVILQNITTPLKEWGSRQPFMYVGFDHTLGTQHLINYYKNRFPKGARYAVLYGTQGYVSEMRGDSFIHALGMSGKYTMLDSYYADFDREKAYTATKAILEKHQNVDFIYSCSTDIGIGAIDALKEKNLLGKIPTNGWGGGSSELEAILDKELAATVMRMNDDNGVAMAEAIKLDLQNRSEKVPLIYSGSFQVIDQKSATPESIKRLTNRAFRYSD